MRACVLALLFAGCAAPIVRASRAELGSHRHTARDRAITSTIRGAMLELVRTGECTFTTIKSCERGTIISYSDGFVGESEYFDAHGTRTGSESWSCLTDSHEGKRINCRREAATELVCERALEGLLRIGAQIELDGADPLELPLGVSKVRLAGVNGTIDVGSDATQAVALSLDSEVQAVTVMDRFAAMERLRAGAPVPRAARLPAGIPVALPAQVSVGSNTVVVGVRSRYVVAQ